MTPKREGEAGCQPTNQVKCASCDGTGEWTFDNRWRGRGYHIEKRPCGMCHGTGYVKRSPEEAQRGSV